MPRLGLDYSTPIPVAAHKAHHSTFACRYLSNTPAKNLSRAEADRLRAGGVDVVVVWETSAERSLDGGSAGQSDAREALTQARGCGMPDGRPIYFAVDFDTTAGVPSAVGEYFRGVASVLGRHRTGCYGGFSTIKRLFDERLITYGWQTYAWSGSAVDPRAQLYQYLNGQHIGSYKVDFDHALRPDFGQWGYKGVRPGPGPRPQPGPQPRPLRPPGRALFRGGGIAVVGTEDLGDIILFVHGRDGRVWQRERRRGKWAEWQSLGRPGPIA